MCAGLCAADDERAICGARSTAKKLYDLTFLVAVYFVEPVSREMRQNPRKQSVSWKVW